MFKLIVFITVISAQCLCADEKLTIDVLIESLCPDSLNFVKNQLSPTWEYIKDYVKLTFVPFGKSQSLMKGAQFNCQHGYRECEGNRIMSCALESIKDPSSQVEFVKCYLEVFVWHARSNRLEFGQSCILEAGLNWESDIKSCYESKLGKMLQLNAERTTVAFTPRFIPTIVYNKQFNQNLQDRSLYNFREVVCELLRQTDPQACDVIDTWAYN